MELLKHLCILHLKMLGLYTELLIEVLFHKQTVFMLQAHTEHVYAEAVETMEDLL